MQKEIQKGLAVPLSRRNLIIPVPIFLLLMLPTAWLSCKKVSFDGKIEIGDRLHFMPISYNIGTKGGSISFINENSHHRLEIENCLNIIFTCYGDGWVLSNTNGRFVIHSKKDDVKFRLWYPYSELVSNLCYENISTFSLGYSNNHIIMSVRFENNHFKTKTFIIEGTTNSLIHIFPEQDIIVSKPSNWYQLL